MQNYGTKSKVGETEINVYTEGSGSITLVFMAGSGVGCPALEYKPLYRRLSDRYRIAVVEKAGYGLSGEAKTERTVENLAEESRAALKALDIQLPYVLVPHSYSGFEAIWWANTYPDEVKAVFGLDMGFPNMMKAQAAQIPHEKKVAMVKKSAALMQKIAKRGLLDKLLRNKTVNASGLLSGNELTDEEKKTYEEVYYKNITSPAVSEESILAEANAAKADSTGYLKCPACFAVSNMKSPVKALTWQQAAKDYSEKCNSEVHIFDEGHMMYAFIPDKLASLFSDFLEKNSIA
ncbi:alpha/beta hydrolase [Ruminococcus albus]|uniref:Pimeloyl-ACP methyl ester carboxylesterase n=1 Tax=Ruminococcus albus TaxID=1264 RepID=A0A1H7FQT8_RUMAL|nr:alpha/beta hydrolase [Ruminococcus albus]SEK26842.1 Pimeloyl-ACP methyl ester carboxylesterase [Ruminococcus albus]